VLENRYASLYVYEIRTYADQNGLAAGRLMAYVAAHEIGHLLLGPVHSSSGIMRAAWGEEEYRDMAHGRLDFSEAERQALRGVGAGTRPAVDRPEMIAQNNVTRRQASN